jgi:hypothetical protein
MQPAKSFRDGMLSVSYWEPDGQAKGALRVTFQKRYRASDGVWKTTSTLFLSEIPRAIALLQSAHDYLAARPGAEAPAAEASADCA